MILSKERKSIIITVKAETFGKYILNKTILLDDIIILVENSMKFI